MRPRSVRNPIKATAREPINRPDSYERFPKPREISVANSSRHINTGRVRPLPASLHALWIYAPRSGNPFRSIHFEFKGCCMGVSKLRFANKSYERTSQELHPWALKSQSFNRE